MPECSPEGTSFARAQAEPTVVKRERLELSEDAAVTCEHSWAGDHDAFVCRLCGVHGERTTDGTTIRPVVSAPTVDERIDAETPETETHGLVAWILGLVSRASA